MLRVRYPRDYRWRDEGQLIRIYSFHQVNEPPTYQVEHYRRQHFDRLQTCPRRIVLEGDEHYVCPSREDQFP
jgi:hypothetical protein